MADSALSPSLPEILLKLQSLGLVLDAPAEPTDETLSSLFDRIVSHFSDDAPLPARLADGRPVDLLALFRTVRERGGTNSVSEARSWDSVPAAVGLDPDHGPSLKLLYLKYLDVFSRWVEKVFDGKAEGDSRGSEEISGESSLEVEGLFLEASDQKKDYVLRPLPGSKKVQFLMPGKGSERAPALDDSGDGGGEGNCVIVEREAPVVEALSSPKRNRTALIMGRGNEPDPALDEGGSGCGDGDCGIVERESPLAEVFSSLKRKRTPLLGMLNWVIRSAKNPGHPLVKRLSSIKAKDKSNEFGEIFSQVLLAREAIYIGSTDGSKDGISPFRKKQKMHPSLYEDNCGRVRSSPRLNSSIKQSDSGSCSGTSKMKGDSWDKSLMALGEDSYEFLPDVVCGVTYRNRHRILVGQQFQAEVPEWSPIHADTSTDSDDLKWCGIQFKLPEGRNKTTAEQYLIGKGREDGCRCEHPGSVKCVRFHVSKNRLQLKRELGPAFDAMGFDRMGEEVALSWTEEEERRFKAVVRLNPSSLQKNMWDQLQLSFPLKGRQNLVSYYFNVLLLRRRSYQNRVTPNSIDSDDEDTEIGFLANPAAHESLKHNG